MGTLPICVFLLLGLEAVLCSNETSECPQYIDKCPCFDQTINCSSKRITNMPTFLHYTGNTDIKKLLMRNNFIQKLSKNAFQGLSVTLIDISGNSLEMISDNAFAGLSTVTQLVLKSCRLSTVSMAITHLTSLKKLSMADNFLSNIPKGIFDPLTNLEELNLAGNTIQFLSPFDEFSELKHLEYLDLSRNKLHSISNEVLQNLPALKVLHLENNDLKTISNDLFQNNTKLTSIYLQDNNLVFTDDITHFNALQKLEILQISHCKITKLDKKMFTNKPHLRSLTLQFCAVDVANIGVFDRIISNLHHLDISGSHKLWQEVKNILHQGKKLKMLKIASLNLTDIPTDVFKHMTEMILLDMKNNHIKEINQAAFKGLKGINLKIHLENNQITSVSPFLFQDTSPPLSLYLNNNSLASLGFINENPCGFDRSLLDVTGNEINCDCITAKITQKKIVHLIGTCNATVSDEYDGLTLAPLIGHVPDGGIYLEEKAALVCELESHLEEKYDCCSSEWVSVGTPAACPVSAGIKVAVSGLLNLSSVLALLVPILFYAMENVQ